MPQPSEESTVEGAYEEWGHCSLSNLGVLTDLGQHVPFRHHESKCRCLRTGPICLVGGAMPHGAALKTRARRDAVHVRGANTAEDRAAARRVRFCQPFTLLHTL